jgi:hypothetical protein
MSTPVNPRITTIFFDLGNVIIPFDNARLMTALAGIAPSCADLPRLWRRLLREHETGRLTAIRLHQEFCRLTSASLSYASFQSALTSHFAEQCQYDAIYLRHLRRKYRVFALSNTNEIHMRFVLEKFAVMNEFDGYIRSDEVGALKPSPRIFPCRTSSCSCEAIRVHLHRRYPALYRGSAAAGNPRRMVSLAITGECGSSQAWHLLNTELSGTALLPPSFHNTDVSVSRLRMAHGDRAKSLLHQIMTRHRTLTQVLVSR